MNGVSLIGSKLVRLSYGGGSGCVTGGVWFLRQLVIAEIPYMYVLGAKVGVLFRYLCPVNVFLCTWFAEH